MLLKCLQQKRWGAKPKKKGEAPGPKKFRENARPVRTAGLPLQQKVNHQKKKAVRRSHVILDPPDKKKGKKNACANI